MSEKLNDALPRAIAILGPTAAGKSQLALQCAARYGAPILNCDSVQVYRQLDIGSAKPSLAMRREQSHFLVDVVEPDEDFSAGDYVRLALPLASRQLSVISGGTGLYLRSLAWTQTQALAGLESAMQDARARFEVEWMAREAAATGAVHAALRAVDTETADSIHPRNVVRALRALWLCESLGRPVSEIRREDPPRPRLELFMVVLDPGQDRLNAAIARRCDQMVAAGWVHEVEMLYGRGYDSRFKSMGSLGYRQLLAHVEGSCSLEDAIAETKRATSQYARRQRTYFRHQLPVKRTHWIADAQEFPWKAADAFVQGGLF